MHSEQTDILTAAIAKAQAVMKPAPFNKVNPHFKNKYADLSSVIETVVKPLTDQGIAVTQTTEIRDGGFILVTTLHLGGQWIASEYPLPNVSKPQELGSALTYAKRYSLAAIACVASDEDDDAEGARKDGQTATTPKASPIAPQTVAAPVHPTTGEVGPHKLAEPEGTQMWGQAFIAAVKTARDADEIQQWLTDNAEGLDALNGASEKAYKHVMAAVDVQRNSLKKKAA